MLEDRLWLCEGVMRLIGRSELLAVARAGGVLRGSVLALAAELESAVWQTQADAQQAFPFALIDGVRMTIDIGSDHCAVVAISYEKGVALVENAGLRDKVEAARGKTGGRR